MFMVTWPFCRSQRRPTISPVLFWSCDPLLCHLWRSTVSPTLFWSHDPLWPIPLSSCDPAFCHLQGRSAISPTLFQSCDPPWPVPLRSLLKRCTIKILWPSTLSSTQQICSESNLVSISWRVVTNAIKGGPWGIYQWLDWCWILALSELWKNRSGPSCIWWEW